MKVAICNYEGGIFFVHGILVQGTSYSPRLQLWDYIGYVVVALHKAHNHSGGSKFTWAKNELKSGS